MMVTFTLYLPQNNSELLETTVVNDANIMEPAEELMQSRMKYSDLSEETQDVRDQLIHVSLNRLHLLLSVLLIYR